MFEYSKARLNNIFHDAGHYLSMGNIFPNRRALIVQKEGLGNSILTTPLVQALEKTGRFDLIDVLIDKNKSTDIVFKDWGLIANIFDSEDISRIGNNLIYEYVFECHPRHELPANIKYRHRLRIPVKPGGAIEYYWKFHKHEADYLLTMAEKLGYSGKRPPLRKLAGDRSCPIEAHANTVAIGIGYYKGVGKDWKNRHWGNENFRSLCAKLIDMGFKPVLIGDSKDQETDGRFLETENIESLCGKLPLPKLIYFISRCAAFIGNDTGLMHAAASQNIPVIGIFVTTNSIKSYPLGDRCLAIGGDKGRKYYNIPVETVISEFKKLIDYDK